jgi:phosphoglycolate phosphatase-like HAD superfamily hydrolase/ADP-ribose pyrophosphatase YjhB (NUDIX family)
MAEIKNIIFDWSGTLVDDLGPVVEATNKVFAEFGKPPFTVDDFREKFRLPFTDFYREHLPEATFDQLEAHYHTSFKLLQETIEPLPGALEILQWCRSVGMKVFLLSSIHAEHFAVQGERLGLKEYFDRAYTMVLDKRHKILELLAEYDLNPHETMFVGDMQHDVDAARKGGVLSCAVLTGYDSLAKLTASRPDLLFKDLPSVLRHLQRHREEVVPELHPIATVGAAISNAEGKVLMIRTHKWSNLWGIPGGKIKGGETGEEALRREVKEETGLELREVTFVFVQDCIRSPEFFKPAHFLLLNYAATTDQSDVTLNDEAEEFRWVSPAEASRLPLNTPTRKLLERMEADRLLSGFSSNGAVTVW